MATQSTFDTYRRDEFDNPPAGPAGVHRGKRSFLSRAVPFLVSLLIAALLGFAVWAIATKNYTKFHLPWVSTSSNTTTNSSTVTNNTQNTNGSTTYTPVGKLDYDIDIMVINATDTDDYAASVQAIIEQQGFTDVVAANPTDDLPEDSVVWYENATDETTAEYIKMMTIGRDAQLQQKDDLPASIVVILMH